MNGWCCGGRGAVAQLVSWVHKKPETAGQRIGQMRAIDHPQFRGGWPDGRGLGRTASPGPEAPVGNARLHSTPMERRKEKGPGSMSAKPCALRIGNDPAYSTGAGLQRLLPDHRI